LLLMHDAARGPLLFAAPHLRSLSASCFMRSASALAASAARIREHGAIPPELTSRVRHQKRSFARGPQRRSFPQYRACELLFRLPASRHYARFLCRLHHFARRASTDSCPAGAIQSSAPFKLLLRLRSNSRRHTCQPARSSRPKAIARLKQLLAGVLRRFHNSRSQFRVRRCIDSGQKPHNAHRYFHLRQPVDGSVLQHTRSPAAARHNRARSDDHTKRSKR